MYKNLSPVALGVFGRQGEMLEIALTHRFKGVEIDINEVLASGPKHLGRAGLQVFGQCPNDDWRLRVARPLGW